MKTTAGAMPGNVKFACSFCGVPRFYPAEMAYVGWGKFRCDWHSNETLTTEEMDRQTAQMPRSTGDTPRFPVGVPAEWQS